MRKSNLLHRILGIIYLVFGVSLLLNSFQGITGFVIFSGTDLGLGWFLGIVFVIIGIAVLFVSGLEKNVTVYDVNKKEKNKERSYMLVDVAMYFGKKGSVTLEEFRREIEGFRREEGGEELVNIVQREYGPSLHKIAESNDEEKSKIARAFLEILEPDYSKDEYTLSKEEKQEIKDAFRDWSGRPTNFQRKTLRKHNLFYEHSGRHPKIRYKDSGYFITVSLSPSDRRRSGLAISKELMDLIEKCKKVDRKYNVRHI